MNGIDSNSTGKSTNNTENSQQLQNGIASENTTMTSKDKFTFIKELSQTIPQNFSGNARALRAFLDKARMVHNAIDDAGQKDIFKDFLLTKLEGGVRNLVKDTDSVDNILKILQKEIKVDSSKVIEGRMLTLNLNKLTCAEYSAQAERLAEELEESLTLEGISLEKAREMAVDKTVDMCRQSARSELVKSVLAALKFENPKEAIS